MWAAIWSGAAQPLLEALRQLNGQVLAAVILMQLTASSAYYFHAFRPQYMRLANSRQAAFHSTQLPHNPLRALLGAVAAAAVLAAVINLLVAGFEIDTWLEGLQLSAALLVIDACLNARHYLFEGRPLQLFLLHAGYHALVLTGCCCLLAVFGQPLASGGSSSEGSGGRARCSAAHLNRAEL